MKTSHTILIIAALLATACNDPSETGTAPDVFTASDVVVPPDTEEPTPDVADTAGSDDDLSTQEPDVPAQEDDLATVDAGPELPEPDAGPTQPPIIERVALDGCGGTALLDSRLVVSDCRGVRFHQTSNAGFPASPVLELSAGS